MGIDRRLRPLRATSVVKTATNAPFWPVPGDPADSITPGERRARPVAPAQVFDRS